MTKNLKPGELVFSCGMISPITHITNQNKIHDEKIIIIKKDHMQEKTKCIEYYYKVNGLVLLYYKQTHNHEAPYKGPYKIIQTWKSGTATLCMVSVKYRVYLILLEPYQDQTTGGFLCKKN